MAGLELEVFLLHLLALPPCSAVLEPDGDLAWVEPKLGGQPVFPRRLQLVLAPKVRLQEIELLLAQLPLLPHLDTFPAPSPLPPPPPLFDTRIATCKYE